MRLNRKLQISNVPMEYNYTFSCSALEWHHFKCISTPPPPVLARSKKYGSQGKLILKSLLHLYLHYGKCFRGRGRGLQIRGKAHFYFLCQILKNCFLGLIRNQQRKRAGSRSGMDHWQSLLLFVTERFCYIKL